MRFNDSLGTAIAWRDAQPDRDVNENRCSRSLQLITLRNQLLRLRHKLEQVKTQPNSGWQATKPMLDRDWNEIKTAYQSTMRSIC